jgi:uncharacterized protein
VWKTAKNMINPDVDRMEALGAIGLARTFYTADLLGSSMFNEEDPLGKSRRSTWNS